MPDDITVVALRVINKADSSAAVRRLLSSPVSDCGRFSHVGLIHDLRRCVYSRFQPTIVSAVQIPIQNVRPLGEAELTASPTQRHELRG